MQKSSCCQRQVALHSAFTDPAQMTSENMVASLGNKKHSRIFRKPSASVRKEKEKRNENSKYTTLLDRGLFRTKLIPEQRPRFKEILRDSREVSRDGKEQ